MPATMLLHLRITPKATGCAEMKYITTPWKTVRACADRLNALAEAGRLNAKVAITLPLSEARRANEMIEDRDLRLDGKIIVIPP